MKFIHLSDLHIGKKLKGQSLIEDQKYVFDQLYKIIDENKVDCVLISGDIYDVSNPSIEAIHLFEELLIQFEKRKLKVFIIAGNHDSVDRLSFGANFFKNSDIYISKNFDGKMDCVVVEDDYGPINIYLLPFIRYSKVNNLFDNKLKDDNEAIKAIIETTNINKQERNIILSHQFITGATTCESEELTVGTSSNVSREWYDDFDYVALGHIHKPQYFKRDTMRYSGTLLKYSISEAHDQKSVPIIEMFEKGNTKVTLQNIKPLYDLVEIEDTFEQVVSDTYKNKYKDWYVYITLNNDVDIIDCANKLRMHYPHYIGFRYARELKEDMDIENKLIDISALKPIDLIFSFYKESKGIEMDENNKKYVEKLLNEKGEN